MKVTAKFLRDWRDHKAGDELTVTQRWMGFAQRSGIAEQVTKKKTTASKKPTSDKED